MSGIVIDRGRWAAVMAWTVAAVLLSGETALGAEPGAVIRDCDQAQQLPGGGLNAGGELGDAVTERDDLGLGTVGAPGPGCGYVALGHDGVCGKQRRRRGIGCGCRVHVPS